MKKLTAAINIFYKFAIQNTRTELKIQIEENIKNMNFSDKQVILMRGISGAGKSEAINTIKKLYPETKIVSADFYFMKDETGNVKENIYNFDPSKLREAHGESQSQFKTYLEGGQSPIIVDNTNLRKWEMEFYIKTANELGYNYKIINIDTPVDIIKKRQKNRGVKEVPEQAVDRMNQALQTEELPDDIKDRMHTFEGYSKEDL